VRQRILRRILMIEPGSVQVTVDDGVVTLTGRTGRTGRKSTALAAVGLTEAVAGVAGVVDRLSFDTDDTVRTPTPRPPADHPMHGWWVDRRHNEHASGTAARAMGTDHGRSADPRQPATLETVR
jgi:BON domain